MRITTTTTSATGAGFLLHVARASLAATSKLPGLCGSNTTFTSTSRNLFVVFGFTESALTVSLHLQMITFLNKDTNKIQCMVYEEVRSQKLKLR